jgi:hypothetical protein
MFYLRLRACALQRQHWQKGEERLERHFRHECPAASTRKQHQQHPLLHIPAVCIQRALHLMTPLCARYCAQPSHPRQPLGTLCRVSVVRTTSSRSRKAAEKICVAAQATLSVTKIPAEPYLCTAMAKLEAPCEQERVGRRCVDPLHTAAALGNPFC